MIGEALSRTVLIKKRRRARRRIRVRSWFRSRFASARGVSGGYGASVSRARSRHGVCRGPGHGQRVGYPRGADGPACAVAERVRRTGDRIDPPAVPRSCDHHECPRITARLSSLRVLLPRFADPLVARQRRAALPPSRAAGSRAGRGGSAGRRAPSSVRPPRSVIAAPLQTLTRVTESPPSHACASDVSCPPAWPRMMPRFTAPIPPMNSPLKTGR